MHIFFDGTSALQTVAEVHHGVGKITWLWLRRVIQSPRSVLAISHLKMWWNAPFALLLGINHCVVGWGIHIKDDYIILYHEMLPHPGYQAPPGSFYLFCKGSPINKASFPTVTGRDFASHIFSQAKHEGAVSIPHILEKA